MLTIHNLKLNNETLEFDDNVIHLIDGEAIAVDIGDGDVIDDDTAKEFETLGFTMEEDVFLSAETTLDLAYVLVVETPGKIAPEVHEAVQNIVDDFNSSFIR